MMFQFAPAIQAGINSGVYEIVRNTATGELLGIARNKVTGQFVAQAIGLTTQATGFTINPLFAPAQLVMGGLQMVQTHKGFQKTYRMLDALQASVGVLQATTAVIGVGTVVGAVLSAVNLRQTLKLREDVKQLRLEVKDGFIDLKKVLKEQQEEIIQRIDHVALDIELVKGQQEEIIQRIDYVAQDIEFKHHRTILVRAYGLFAKAIARLQLALMIQDVNLRNLEISGLGYVIYGSSRL